MTPFMIDACAGLGGASAAMLERGWKVVTLDIDPRFECDIIADLCTWSWEGPRPDLMWFSIPCDEFAREGMPWSATGQSPDLSLAQAVRRIVAETQPRFWVLENVKSARRWFEPLFGSPRFVSNPYYLWGFFPDLGRVTFNPVHKEHLSSSAAAARAMIPYGLSLAVARAVELTQVLA